MQTWATKARLVRLGDELLMEGGWRMLVIEEPRRCKDRGVCHGHVVLVMRRVPEGAMPRYERSLRPDDPVQLLSRDLPEGRRGDEKIATRIQDAPQPKAKKQPRKGQLKLF